MANGRQPAPIRVARGLPRVLTQRARRDAWGYLSRAAPPRGRTWMPESHESGASTGCSASVGTPTAVEAHIAGARWIGLVP